MIGLTVVQIATIGVPIVAILSQFIGKHSKLTLARAAITIVSVLYCLIGLTANGLSMEKFNEPFKGLFYLDLFIMLCLIVVNQGYRWLKIARPILCALFCICTLVAGVMVLMEGMYGGEEVFNREFTECTQQQKNAYFDHQHFSNIIGIDPPADYNVTAYEIHIIGPDSETEYELTFVKQLTDMEQRDFIGKFEKNGWEQSENDKFCKRTEQDETSVEINKRKMFVQYGTY